MGILTILHKSNNPKSLRYVFSYALLLLLSFEGSAMMRYSPHNKYTSIAYAFNTTIERGNINPSFSLLLDTEYSIIYQQPSSLVEQDTTSALSENLVIKSFTDQDSSKVKINVKKLLKLDELDIDISAINGLPMYYTRDRHFVYAHSRGKAGVSIGIVPIRCEYNYASYSIPSGVNRFFRISLDNSKLVDRLKERSAELADSLSKEKLRVDSIIGLQNAILLKTSRTLAEYKKLDQLNDKSVPNTNIPALPKDSLDLPPNYVDSLDIGNLELEQYSHNIKIKDSLNVYSARVAEIKEKIKNLELQKAKFNMISETLSQDPLSNPFYPDKNKKLNQLLASTKKFVIGIHNANNGMFLTQGTPIRGIYLENQFDNLFTAFGTGRMRDFSRGTNQLPQSQSNFFQQIFGNKESDARVTVAQLGMVSKGNSIKFGYLNYSKPTRMQESDPGSVQVLSVDGMWVFLKNIKLQVGAARSMYNNQQEDTPLQESISDNNKANNYAVGAHIEGSIRKTKTNIEANVRLVQAQFYNPALFFLRSDHTQFQFQIRQQLFKKSQLRLFLNNEFDGITINPEVATQLVKWGGEYKQRIGKCFQTSIIASKVLMYSEIPLRDTIIGESELLQKSALLNNSYSVGQSVSFNKRVGENYFTAMVMANFYHFEQNGYSSDLILINNAVSYTKASFSISGNFGIQSALGKQEMLTFQDRYMGDLIVDYNLKRHLISITLSSLTETQQKTQFGYRGSYSFQLSQQVRFGISYEEILTSDFTNSLEFYNQDQPNYRIMAHLSIRLK